MIDVFSSGSDYVGMTKPLFLLATIAFCFFVNESRAEDLMAGVGKVDITREGADAGENPLWVKAVAISRGETHAIIISVDAVAIAEIGSIKDPYLKNVRSAVQKSLGISPESIVVNASHCHGVVALDVEKRTIDAITMAWKNRVPVRAGTGSGDENRVGENRRLILKDGSQADVRHA